MLNSIKKKIYNLISLHLQADKAHNVLTMLENLVFGSSKPIEVNYTREILHRLAHSLLFIIDSFSDGDDKELYVYPLPSRIYKNPRWFRTTDLSGPFIYMHRHVCRLLKVDD